MFYVLCLLHGSERQGMMYTFIHKYVHSHGYEDATIHHQRTSKNTITLLNFPYIHSHIQSHSPRAPPWPSPPAFCGLVLPVNQYVRGRFSRLTFLPLELSTNIIQVVYLQNRSTTLWVIKKKQDTLIIILLNVDRLSTFFLYSGLSGKRFRTNHTSNASSLYYLVRRKCQESSDNLKEVSCFTIKLSLP